MEHREEVREQSGSMDSLPDDILIHILSFLPMKQAALTSVLSKRWRTLFAFTHNLEFVDPYVCKRENRWRDWRVTRKIFRDFMYRTLTLRAGSRVKKLSLTLNYDPRDNRSMNHWIRYALKHGVSELNLCIRKNMSFLTRLLTSTTLVKLSLGSSFVMNSLPSSTCLPSLKVLLLDQIDFRKRSQISDVLLAGCPLLEDLTIHYGYCSGYANALFSKTIKNLYYSGKPLFEYYQFDLLVNATLHLGFCYKRITRKNVAKFMSGIRNVKTLDLCICDDKVISVLCKDELPMFNNLVHLVFSSCEECLRVLLPRLLECSPNLKVLVLSGLRDYTFRQNRLYVEIQIPLENQIEMLSIKQYQGSTNELKDISHFLLNMKCLKVVKIYFAYTVVDEPKKMQLTKDLMKLPTASYEVKIQVI